MFDGQKTVQIIFIAGGGSPGRKQVYEHAFSSTAYPPQAHLFMHNELTYTSTPPKYIFFFCVQPAAIGGETAIADSKEIYSKIDPAITKQLEDRGVKYSRLFIDEKRLAEIDVHNYQITKTWQLAFGVQSSEQAEQLARQVGYEDIRWYPNGDMLIKTKTLPATRSTEKIWFNQVQGWDPRIAADANAINENLHLTIQHPYEELFQYYPQGCYYGDTDEIISYDELKHINDVTWSCAHNLDWKAGDLLWIDNFQTAHGKRPHVDNNWQRRQILASLADP
ncbi:unnamed protein product [Didymodactylos carnosus]|uniref:TauD/TfdA-like domain-containing protein n=1 Tax=Didymodactylos carnosus TaxID=1234261 RepID=A0A815DSL8_9BILA|nr:unnamed protein product [Didymodactylos carnosus]CAF1527586.1 unnamed protein product [Didymodactylos carnosus]CAF4127235.1 unnamed protein product [Didymodactylos carnosus]CAF4314286.1 unnamed protein product [Didymodactylos carnosus]